MTWLIVNLCLSILIGLGVFWSTHREPEPVFQVHTFVFKPISNSIESHMITINGVEWEITITPPPVWNQKQEPKLIGFVPEGFCGYSYTVCRPVNMTEYEPRPSWN